MKNVTRRVFMLNVAAGASALSMNTLAQSAAPMVEEKDGQAVALGYMADTTKVDAKKYPKHTVEQKCAGCQLFGGKGKDASGSCPLFVGKQVAAGGWCSAYVKKVG